jgi:hypothetical protein
VHATDNSRHVKISENFTTLLNVLLLFSTVYIFFNILLSPFNKSMHSCPVTVLLLSLQLLQHAVLQCLFICVMASSQAVFQTNKPRKSDGARLVLQDGCGKTGHPNFLMAWHSYGEATMLTFFGG